MNPILAAVALSVGSWLLMELAVLIADRWKS